MANCPVIFAALALIAAASPTAVPAQPSSAPVVRPVGGADRSDVAASDPKQTDDGTADDESADEANEEGPVPEWHALREPRIKVEYYPAHRPDGVTDRNPTDEVKMLGFSPEHLFIRRGNGEEPAVPWSHLYGVVTDGWAVDLRQTTTDEADYEAFTRQARTPKNATVYALQTHETVMAARERAQPARQPTPAPAVAATPPPPAPAAVPIEAPAVAAPAPAGAQGIDTKLLIVIGVVALLILVMIFR